jgi:hypothetical protein
MWISIKLEPELGERRRSGRSFATCRPRGMNPGLRRSEALGERGVCIAYQELSAHAYHVRAEGEKTRTSLVLFLHSSTSEEL